MIVAMSIESFFTACGLTEMPTAVFWDMDGTVIDSEPEWARASRKVVESFGGTWTKEDVTAIVGANRYHHGSRMREAIEATDGDAPDWQHLFHAVADLVLKHYRTDAQLMPGAKEALTAVNHAGIPQALVTASPQSMVEALEELVKREVGLNPFLDFVCAEDKATGKPSPEPYLLGAKKIGVDITGSLVFEDSGPGVASGKAAGATVVDLRNISLADLAERFR